MKLIVFTAVLSALIFLTSCAHKTESVSTRTPQQVDDYEQQQAAYLKEVAASFVSAGLPKPTIKIHPGSEHLTVTFGKLTPNQFQIAKKTFFYPRLPSAYAPTYSASKSYELLDFLPPKAQALANKRVFGSFDIPIPPWFQKYTSQYLGHTQDKILSDTNCWGTVHDVLISTQFPTRAILFNTDQIISYYQDPKFFSTVPNAQSLKPYDVVLFYYDNEGKKDIEHAALYLGHGLIYQKDGLSEIDHYRITFLKTRSGLEDHLYYRPLANVPIQTAEQLYSFTKMNPTISPDLATELKDPAKLAFFKSLIFIPKGNGAGDNYFMSSFLTLPLTKNAQTGRYQFNNKTFPGKLIIDPLKKKFVDY